jgi:hypothetical protein
LLYARRTGEIYILGSFMVDTGLREIEWEEWTELQGSVATAFDHRNECLG